MNNKKKTNPKILILTQINPLNVSYIYEEICSRFADHNEVFSPQIMAILGELTLKENPEDLKHSYRVLNAAFVKNIKAATQKMNPLKPWVFIGNCAKKDIKFDYILGFDGGEDFGNEEIFDLYIHNDQSMLQEAKVAIDYHTKDEVEYFFPTIGHLCLFLDGLQLERNKPNDRTK